MKNVDIISKVVGRKGEAMASPSKDAAPVNLSGYLLKEVWDKCWEIRTTDKGEEYIFGKLPVAVQFGLTSYVDGGYLDLPSIYDGLVIDNQTIYWEEIKEEVGTDEEGNPIYKTTKVLKAKGGNGENSGGGGVGSVLWSDIEGKPSWLTDNKISYSDIEGTPNLNNYALKTELPNLSEYVDIKNEQTITGKKNFTTGGLFVNGKQIKYNSKGYWELDGDLLVTGGITSFASSSGFTPSTIMDGVAVDGVTIIKQNGVLVAVGGGSGDSPDLSAYATMDWVSQRYATSSQFDTLSDTVSNKANTSDVYTKSEVDTKVNEKWTTNSQKISNWDAAFSWGNHAEGGYVKSDSLTETLKSYVTVGGKEMQTITGKKNFTGGLLVNGQELVYNDDGYWKMEGNLLVTGGITSYSSDGKASPFLIDANTWEGITSDSATQVYTAKATSLLKAQLVSTDSNAQLALNRLTNLNTSLKDLSASSLSDLVTKLKELNF